MSGKKIFVLILASLLVLPGIVSCSSSPSDNASDGSQSQNASDSSPEESAETTQAGPNLPDTTFDGRDFTILITGNTENNWQKNDFRADEITGDVLSDARYERNQTVEDKFGVALRTVEEYGSTKGSGSGYTLISKSVLAGDAAYDVGMINAYDICNLACAGYLFDLNTLPYLDLTNAWWDQKANADLTIQGRMYYTTGDISTADNDATSCYLFNKKLVNDFGLESPYDLVKGGTWTFDKMASMGTSVSEDLNGDGKYDKNDRFGNIVWDDSIMAAVNGTLGKCAEVNSDGEIELTLNNERTFSMIEKYTTYIYSDACYNYQRVSYDITDPVSMFSNDQALFFMQMLDLTSYFRDMETDFGILPVPKYDEAQETYGHTIGSWHSQFLCVPYVVADEECTGIILEALAYESMETVTPAYYDKTLIGKYFRDDESIAMLDIILSTRVYDLGWYYQLGLYNDEILYLVYEKDADFASRYAKYESKAEEDVKRINETFADTFARG